MFDSLIRGENVSKEWIQKEFDVSSRTVEREIKAMREIFRIQNRSGKIKIENGEYTLDSNGNQIGLANRHLLAMTKVLLGSRAFSKKEIDRILNALDRMYDSNQTRWDNSLIDLVENEHFNYKAAKSELKVEGGKRREIFTDSAPAVDKIWELNRAARENKKVILTYKKENKSEKEHEVGPRGVLFSEYYFYLVARVSEKEDITFRLDRIQDYEVLEERFEFKEEERFKEGEFNNQLPYMIPGSPYKLKFKYDGPSLSAVVNKLPSTEKIEDKGDYYLITARVRSRYGAKMMLLSQQDNIEVLEPKDLRQEMKKTIADMHQKYQD